MLSRPHVWQLILTLLLLSACAKKEIPEPATAPHFSDLSAKVTFKSYLNLGFPEQDVFVEIFNGSRVAERYEVKPSMDPEKTALTLIRRANTAAAAVPHDPLKTGMEPLGPFTKGKSLGISLQAWANAQGVGHYTVKDGMATLKVDLWKMMRNGTYSLWCSRTSKTTIVEKPCMEPGQPGNPIKTDFRAQAELEATFPAMPDTTTETGSWISLAFHSDGHENAIMNDFGKATHVQLLWKIPSPAEMRPAY